MATTLVYTISPYVPFTKILSANVNQDKTDIQNRLNWAGGTSTTTGLGNDNLQSNTASSETQATVTTQGVTLTAVAGQGSNGNSITITFTSGAIAGSEVVTVAGTAISVQIATGVSTVTQVVTALNASTLSSALVVASGSSASTVATAVAVSLAGGVLASGITRNTKLALDTANYVLINNSSGQMSSEAFLARSRGGLGSALVLTNPGDVLQVNSAGTGITSGVTPASPSIKVFNFYQYV